MTVTLDTVITWKSAGSDDLLMLRNLQANILKEHTRDCSTILFLTFSESEGGKEFMRSIAPHLKSAIDHLHEIALFKDKKIPGSPYVGMGLTATGYKTLGITSVPNDAAFLRGMQGTPELNDPDVDTWDMHFRDPEQLHAVVLIGDARLEPMSQKSAEILALINAHPSVQILGSQDGHAMHNIDGEGIEHFGYVDGRSQPLFFKEDIDAQVLETDGTSVWNPEFPVRQAIVADPAAPAADKYFGSYFIFRKLEQNVKMFKEHESALAASLELEDEERAGAMLLGRFEDGTPVTAQFADGNHNPVPNNFNYKNDVDGGKCPFLGHIRKTNPRGSGGFGQSEENERAHLMPRRGLTYGLRTDNPNDGKTPNKPEKDVGLLFMAFNSNIVNQFEFTQIVWANNTAFPQAPDATPPGVDPVIGQLPKGTDRAAVSVPVEWGKPGSMKSVPSIPLAVTMKGGAYFFMPSLAFFQAL